MLRPQEKAKRVDSERYLVGRLTLALLNFYIACAYPVRDLERFSFAASPIHGEAGEPSPD